MTGAVPYRPPLTFEDLVELEQETQRRHELVDGVAYAMVGRNDSALSDRP